jgi:hypothetical protein
MLERITDDTQIEFQFNKKALAPYFDLVFHEATVDERIMFFKNLLAVAQRSLGLAHCIQHDMVSRAAIQEGSSQKAKDTILPLGYSGVVGCWSGRKRSDTWSLNGLTVDGTKRWITNIHESRYFTGQIMRDNVKYSIYIDLNETKHHVGYDNFTPMGMQLANPGDLTIDQQLLTEDNILGISNTPQFFQQDNLASYCWNTNHFGITKQLFLDLKQYAERFKCGAEFEIKKLEMDLCSLQMQWEDNLATLGATTPSHVFWNKRNTQYAYSKKTLIRVIQLVLELGVSYWTDATAEYSQRFRDAITYCSHQHPLYRFGQEHHMLNLENSTSHDGSYFADNIGQS